MYYKIQLQGPISLQFIVEKLSHFLSGHDITFLIIRQLINSLEPGENFGKLHLIDRK